MTIHIYIYMRISHVPVHMHAYVKCMGIYMYIQVYTCNAMGQILNVDQVYFTCILNVYNMYFDVYDR